MIFSFNEFQFDSDQITLTKAGKVVQLSEKPAQMLRLFLLEANQIHSKATLLETIWPDRVVTEQVIFQNISLLRALFGDDAIKTFPKKGYQWQLPLTIVEKKEVKPQKGYSKSEHLADKQSFPNFFYSHSRIFVALFFVCVICVALLWSLPINTTSNVNNVENKSTLVKLFDAERQSYFKNVSQLPIKAQDVFDSPYLAWNTSIKNHKNWLVASKLYEIDQKVVLRFHIQGAKRGLQDYLIGNSRSDVQSQLEQLLITLSSTNYFSVPLENTARAELTILSNKLPNNDIVINQLIKTNYTLNEFDRATMLIDQQLLEAKSDLHVGLLHLLKAKITLWNRQEQIAGESLNKALIIFRSLGLLHLESEALLEQGWFYLATQQFRKGIQVLNQAASKARTAQEPLLEVKAHLNQAFMASKAGQIELSHAQIGLAKELITLHALDNIHQIQVLNNASWLATSEAEKLTYNKDILLMPYVQQYERYFYAAAQTVRNYYIKKQQWDSAAASIKPWQRESFQLLSLAYINLAQSENQKAELEAQRAFRVAQLNHYKTDALDAALLLLQVEDNLEGDNKSIYINYIKQNATNRWLSQNRESWHKISEDNH